MRTLYNNGRQGEFSIKLTKLPEALKQKATSQHEKENKEAHKIVEEAMQEGQKEAE